MMGRQSRQTAMIFVDIESLIPETHLLRKIERMVSFDFIYDLLAPYYPATGRPSVDPVSMFKMLLIGYLYGIKSERRLVEEVQLNIAYRWFCGFELDDTIPNHSTFSKTRTRKWQQSDLFQKSFYEIVKQCIDPCCLIAAQASTAIISCSGKAIFSMRSASASFFGCRYVGYTTAPFIIKKLAYVAGSRSPSS